MKRCSLPLLACALLLATHCAHKDGDSLVVTGDGHHLSSQAIDADPTALLPAHAVGVAYVDAKAFFGSPFGKQLAQLATKVLPVGQESGFVPERDLRTVWLGAYSMAGADVVGVVQGDFQPDLIRAAADRNNMTPLGMPLVHSHYADNDVYTVGNVGFSVLTTHTALVGNETGMRRAMDRIRDNQLHQDLPPWIASLLANPNAAAVLAGDLTGQPQVAAFSRTLGFLNGLQNVRILGNFQPPGAHLAGTLSYPDAASAASSANALRGLGQMAGLMNMLSMFGFSSPLRNLEVSTQQNDVQFVMAVDSQSLTRLLEQLIPLVGPIAPGGREHSRLRE